MYVVLSISGAKLSNFHKLTGDDPPVWKTPWTGIDAAYVFLLVRPTIEVQIELLEIANWKEQESVRRSRSAIPHAMK